jgi:periplasmic divalent cation tolerance protein
MPELKLIYCPFTSLEEARQVARILLQEKLVACANILPGITSLYSWEGQIQESVEVILLLKTTQNLSTKVSERLEEMHSYKTPAILVLPLEAANIAFVDWVYGVVG